MNFGDCPHEGCDNILAVPVPDRTPCYDLIECDKCGGKCWYRLSRVDPTSWTEEEFLEVYHVDHEAGAIFERATGKQIAGKDWR